MMTIDNLIEKKLNTFSFFLALILNLSILFAFSQSFKSIAVKNMISKISDCFQCEIVDEIKNEEPLTEINEMIMTKNETIISDTKANEINPIREIKREISESNEKKMDKPKRLTNKINKNNKEISADKSIINSLSINTDNKFNDNKLDESVFNNSEVSSNNIIEQSSEDFNLLGDKDKGSKTTELAKVSEKGTKKTGGGNIEGDLKSAVISMIINLMEKEKFYPHLARKAGITGVIKINMTIDKSGKIISYSLVNTDANKILADAALETARRVAEHSSLSINLDENIDLIIPIRYELKN